jgi:hypothetical protein
MVKEDLAVLLTMLVVAVEIILPPAVEAGELMVVGVSIKGELVVKLLHSMDTPSRGQAAIHLEYGEQYHDNSSITNIG